MKVISKESSHHLLPCSRCGDVTTTVEFYLTHLADSKPIKATYPDFLIKLCGKCLMKIASHILPVTKFTLEKEEKV